MSLILIISAEPEMFTQIQATFHSGYEIESVTDMDKGLEKLRNKRYDVIIVDLRTLKTTSQDSSYKGVLEPFKALFPTIEIIVAAPLKLIPDAISAIKAGASDYLTYPIKPVELKHVVNNIRDTVLLRSELDYLRGHFWKSESLEVVRTHNDVMKQAFNKIRSVAPTKTTVLLIGETGTGKSLLAKLVHRHSNRQDAQFIEVHCGAIPDTLLESELFGHEKGAFTGAVRRRLGKFEIAKEGTIFLDEIGTITPSAQVKLLQVLQDGHFSRVGGEAVLRSDARVIAATNADLQLMSDEGKFRKDLFYRLNVFPIEIPPLRQRIEDLPFLVDVFLARLNSRYQKNIQNIHSSVLEAFKDYPWPGNIRELENLIERAYILEESKILNPQSFPVELFKAGSFEVSVVGTAFSKLAEARQWTVEAFEKKYLNDLLSRNKGKMNQSATEAGISARQLYKLMTKHGIRKEEFRKPKNL